MRLNSEKLFSFTYGEIKSEELACEVKKKVEGNTTVTEYYYEGGLKLTNTLTLYPENNTYEWVNYYENISDKPTKVISDIFDADVFVSFTKPYLPLKRGYLREDKCYIVNYEGSNDNETEYSEHKTLIEPNWIKKYSCRGGRSCDDIAPYFDIVRENSGVMIGIGWTGQWNCNFEFLENGIRFTCGVENARFYLEPGEKVRCVSFLITEYETGLVDGHNAFRRVMKEKCVLGKGERPAYGRVSAMTWGAMNSKIMLEHVEGLAKNDIGIECFFIDAGWYGHSNKYSKNEHEGDWAEHTGSWNINEMCHPDKLVEVSRKIHENNMEMLMWVEPERARRNTDWAREFPEYMLDIGMDNLLVNIGIEGAWNMVYNRLCELIDILNIQCYRQDFNMEPLMYWRSKDTEDRCSITEIKHINGLYRLLDSLLERFPKLYIDNCSSGGRRNDIEMLSRSLPLWRSDYQCGFNADPDVTQAHGTGASMLMTYSATGINGPMTDTYEMRSCYGSALSAHNWWWTEENPVVECEGMDNLKRVIKEYKAIRPLFSCDFYPLTPYSLNKTDWCVWQYNDAENKKGVVIAFRRSMSEMSKASFCLKGLENGEYCFTDSDTGKSFNADSEKLKHEGVEIFLPEKRSCMLVTYKKI